MRPSALSPDLKRIFAGLAAAAAVIVGTVGMQVIDPPPTGYGLAPLAPQVAPAERLVAASLRPVAATFERLDYSVEAVRTGEAAVPRVLLRTLPDDLDDAALETRKRLFLGIVLPLVLRVNEVIGAQRATLEQLLRRREAGDSLTRRQRAWLAALAAHYRTTPGNVALLRARVRPIPPSLALAQAATESGWGTSRFALSGNALYGQWTWSEETAGIEPRERLAGKTHRVKAYDRLIESVWDYARNLNTNPAYRAFREMRSTRAAGGGRPTGLTLAAALDAYSQKGTAYVALIREVIRQNRLAALDTAKLAPRDTLVAGW